MYCTYPLVDHNLQLVGSINTVCFMLLHCTFVSGYKRGISSFFVFLCYLVSIDSPIREYEDDANHFSIRCFLVELCGKLSAILLYCKSENEHC